MEAIMKYIRIGKQKVIFFHKFRENRRKLLLVLLENYSFVACCSWSQIGQIFLPLLLLLSIFREELLQI
jgi:hypothetical protein